jgi:transposase
LVYPQSGWRLSDVREVGLGKNKKKRRARLYLSKIGFFTLVMHRVFPESQVSRVCVKLYPSGRIHVIFLVGEAESQEGHSSGEGEPVEAVGVDLGLARLATLSSGWAHLGEPEAA